MENTNKYITVIPARGGSQRLPGKNIQSLAGIPLIAHSILYSRKVLPDSEIYVSTDNAQIAKISRQYGAQVIDRPAELSHELSPTAQAIQHTAQELISRGKEFDYIVALQPTNPLRPDGMMEQAIEIMNSGLYRSLFSVSSSRHKLGRLENSQFIPWNYTLGQRSQDMEPLYYENGLLYMVHRELILQGTLMEQQSYPLIVDHIYSSLDIDTQDEFDLTEYYCLKANNLLQNR